MRLDCEAIAGLPCLEEALDCFRDAGLLKFVTNKENWNEELLLQFNASLHILSLLACPLHVNFMNLVVSFTAMP